MRIWFSGAEVPKHRETLARLGVEQMAVNLAPVVKDRGGSLGNEETLSPFPKVFYSSQADLDPEDVEPLIKRYMDDDTLVVGIESKTAIEARRYVPEWVGSDSREAEELAEEYGGVAVHESLLGNVQVMQPLVLFVRRNPSLRLFTTCSKASLLSRLYPTDVIVSGWISAQRYRELQVWDGHKVLRVPRANRATQVEAHRGQITNLGVDFDLVSEGDVYETTSLAIRSWRQYEQVVTTQQGFLLPGVRQEGVPGLATDPVRRRESDDLALLPVLSSAESSAEGDLLPKTASTALRQCDACNLQNVCPKYESSSTCGFSIPVVLRSKTEISNMMTTLLEIQAQRALSAKFQEDLLSQGPTAETSAELERFFRLLEATRRITEDKQTLSITATSATGPGVLSSLFGSHVGEAVRQLPQPVTSDEIIEDADLVDVDE